jgi:hypothetical protein
MKQHNLFVCAEVGDCKFSLSLSLSLSLSSNEARLLPVPTMRLTKALPHEIISAAI